MFCINQLVVFFLLTVKKGRKGSNSNRDVLIFRAAECVPMLPLGLKETKEVDFKTALEVFAFLSSVNSSAPLLKNSSL